MQRIVKPKTQRVKRALEQRAPKLEENTKTAVFIRGGHTSEMVTQALKDFYALKKPDAVLFRRKNIMRPFEDASSVEFFSQKNDASLFMFGSHSKKRPHNLVIGRLFNYQVLDMVEVGIEKFKSVHEFKVWGLFALAPRPVIQRSGDAVQQFGDKNTGCTLGSKPCLVFSGDLFETDLEYIRLKNVLIDFFRGASVTKIRLAGLDHVMCFVAVEGKIYVRSYQIQLKKSGARVPRVELEEMGPSLDVVMRRTHLASADLYKQACKQPKATTKPKKIKNVSHDAFGTRLGRVHMQRQDFGKLQTRKMKGLKRSRGSANEGTGYKRLKLGRET